MKNTVHQMNAISDHVLLVLTDNKFFEYDTEAG